jgi:hypothetical protein
VVKLDQSSAIHLAQAVLNVRDDGIRHKQRPVEFQQSRPLDSLNVSPQMTVLTSQVAVPSPPGHGSSFIGIDPLSGVSLCGPSCSSNAAKVASSEART